MSFTPAEQANSQLVDRMIAGGALWSPPLIAAFRNTPRHCFLDRIYQFQRKSGRWQETVVREPGPDELRVIYSDRALITRLGPRAGNAPETPISSSSQPSLMAQMLEDLRLRPGLRVLEIGAGTGYNAALMAHVVGPEFVTSIDVDRRVLSEAQSHLRAFTDRRIDLRHADGRQGHAARAPYDRIMVTAATPDLEPAWLQQLGRAGQLLAPLALAPGLAFVVRARVVADAFEGQLMRAAYFMPLRAENEAGEPDVEVLPTSGPLRSMPVPWADWFDRRRARIPMHGFLQSLAFYAWLQGYRIHYRTLADGQGDYGVSWGAAGEAEPASLCWLGGHDWQFTDTSARELAMTLWRAFLDAGGPWPTEFRLRASPAGGLVAPPLASTFVRQGPRCQQVWELVEPRDRPAWI